MDNTLQFSKPEKPEQLIEHYDLIKLKNGSCDFAVISLDPKKIDGVLRQKFHGYVGSGGSDENSKPEKHTRVQLKIKRSENIDTPLMSAANWDSDDRFLKSVTVSDGRHRLYYLALDYKKHIQVVVPCCQKELFLRAFG